MSSATTPTLVADDPITTGRRHRARRQRSSALPYWLLLPSVAVLVIMLGYPIYRLGVLSVHEFGLPQIFGKPAAFVGLDNFREILSDRYFWRVLWRTLLFCAVNVFGTQYNPARDFARIPLTRRTAGEASERLTLSIQDGALAIRWADVVWSVPVAVKETGALN